MPQLHSALLPSIIKCPHCAAKMDLDDQERVTKRFECPACNRLIDLTGSVGTGDEANSEAQQAQPQAQKSVQKKKTSSSNAKAILGLVFIAIILLVVAKSCGGFFSDSGKQGPSKAAGTHSESREDERLSAIPGTYFCSKDGYVMGANPMSLRATLKLERRAQGLCYDFKDTVLDQTTHSAMVRSSEGLMEVSGVDEYKNLVFNLSEAGVWAQDGKSGVSYFTIEPTITFVYEPTNARWSRILWQMEKRGESLVFVKERHGEAIRVQTE